MKAAFDEIMATAVKRQHEPQRIVRDLLNAEIMQDSIPEAWKDGLTTALALSVALSAKTGQPVPWTVLRRAIDDSIKARWIELATNSGP